MYSISNKVDEFYNICIVFFYMNIYCRFDVIVYICVICVYLLQDEKIIGIIQLYSVDEDIIQCIGVYVVCFSSYQYFDNMVFFIIFCVGLRDVQDYGKVIIKKNVIIFFEYQYVFVVAQNFNIFFNLLDFMYQ